MQLRDFKVVRNSISSVDKNVVAITRTGITYYLTTNKRGGKPTNITISVEATVYKQYSFIKEKVLGFDTGLQQRLLIHEQKHFDISEIFARQAVRQLQTMRLTGNYRKEIANYVQAKFKAAELYQHRYDKETRHGEDHVAQEKWNEDIAAQLRELEAYKKKVVVKQLPGR